MKHTFNNINNGNSIYKKKPLTVNNDQLRPEYPPPCRPCKDDGLPNLICKDCTRQLKRAYTFNIQCEESDKKLRSHLKHKQIINGWKEVTDDCNIKVEDLSEKTITGEVVNGLQNTVKTVEDLIKTNDGIKLEPEYKLEDEDSCWDADDDNLLLKEIKSKRESIGTFFF
ncbi:hypothetical protein RR48_00860 [Papilio machaon]|uniref:ZAD domain-containing protein n=1 Tax=Papilio machaon TaxID=76193 RepID=A0A0N1IQH1_PAPMA|nr:hypothetical protein RR48_00860 [Papilio machaon]